MKFENVSGRLMSGWRLLVKGAGTDDVQAFVESPDEVPDSTDPIFHRLPQHGGGPEHARKTKVRIPVPPQHVPGLLTLMGNAPHEDIDGGFVAYGVGRPAPAEPPKKVA